MKKNILTATAIFLSSCTSFDSLQPFDQKQAALVMRQYYNVRPAQQMIKINLSQTHAWKKIDISPEKKGTPVILIPKNQTADNWNESITTKIAPFIGDQDITAKKLVQKEFEIAAKNCKQITPSILDETESFVTYSLNTLGCKTNDNANEIGKAFNGNDAVYLVKYSTRVNHQVTINEFNKMTTIIKSARLVKDPRHRMSD